MRLEDTDFSWTSKVGAVNMNNRWAIPVGTPLVLVPYIIGESDEVALSTTDSFYVDNFAVHQTIP